MGSPFRLGDKWVESDRLFVKWNGEPTRTPYEPSKSAINRRFCYNHQKVRSIKAGADFFIG